jgi:hypothetical protein
MFAIGGWNETSPSLSLARTSLLFMILSENRFLLFGFML